MAQGNGSTPVRRELAIVSPVPTDVQKWEATIDQREVRISVALVAARYAGTYPLTKLECWNFIEVCRSQGARPFEDIHIIKYDAGAPAQPVCAYTFLMARAKRDPYYNNFDLWFVDEKGKRIHEGLEVVGNIVAAVCVVKNKKRDPIRFVARLKEFNKGQAMWKVMGVHMLGKCAIAGAHRLADPGNLGGMHIAEEFGGSEEEAAAQVRLAEPILDAEILEEHPPGEAPGEKGQPAPQDEAGEAQTPVGEVDTPIPTPAATAEPPAEDEALVPGPWADEFEKSPEPPKRGKGKAKETPAPAQTEPEVKAPEVEAPPESVEEPKVELAAEDDRQRVIEETLAGMEDAAVIVEVRNAMARRFAKRFAEGKAWASEVLGKTVTKMGDLPVADFRKLLLHIWVEAKES